eukprot:764802-Hanusia_phi.AAC.3
MLLHSSTRRWCISSTSLFAETHFSRQAKQFPKVSVKYQRGAPPTLYLKDEKGGEIDKIRIDSWNTDTIVEFMKVSSPKNLSASELSLSPLDFSLKERLALLRDETNLKGNSVCFGEGECQKTE